MRSAGTTTELLGTIRSTTSTARGAGAPELMTWWGQGVPGPSTTWTPEARQD